LGRGTDPPVLTGAEIATAHKVEVNGQFPGSVEVSLIEGMGPQKNFTPQLYEQLPEIDGVNSYQVED
jgi:hypothetical protein